MSTQEKHKNTLGKDSRCYHHCKSGGLCKWGVARPVASADVVLDLVTLTRELQSFLFGSLADKLHFYQFKRCSL